MSTREEVDLMEPVSTEVDISTLGGRLRDARLTSKLTQAEVAERAGTTQAVVQKVENGGSKRPRIVVELAAAVAVPVEYLLCGVVADAAIESIEAPAMRCATHRAMAFRLGFRGRDL